MPAKHIFTFMRDVTVGAAPLDMMGGTTLYVRSTFNLQLEFWKYCL